MRRSSTPRRMATPRLVFVVVLVLCAFCDLSTAIVGRSSRRSSGRQRIHYVACEEEPWDYAPSGKDMLTGLTFGQLHDHALDTHSGGAHDLTPHGIHSHDPLFWMGSGPDRIGREYVKARYVEYTGPSFVDRVPRPEHWGILGPILRANVGDTLLVHFKNNCNHTYSMHPHGLRYTEDMEGAAYLREVFVERYKRAGHTDDEFKRHDGEKSEHDGLVEPGEMYTYEWTVPPSAGPGPADGNHVVWPYHSHVNEPADVASGLYGAIVVCRSGCDHNGPPPGFDREFFVLYTIFDENMSHYTQINMEMLTALNDSQKHELMYDAEFRESNMMYSINGFTYANLPAIKMNVGEKVLWHVLSMGNEDGIHTAHWHGETILNQGQRKDMIELLPGSFHTVVMDTHNPGVHLAHCAVFHHLHGGMTMLFEVSSASTHTPTGPRMIVLFSAALAVALSTMPV